jgi:hypothetical protein
MDRIISYNEDDNYEDVWQEIANTVNQPDISNNELEKLRGIVKQIKAEVTNIETIVLSPIFGLKEVKEEVINIEELAELMLNGVNKIDAKLDGLALSLAEIKAKLTQMCNNTSIEKIFSKSSGPFIAVNEYIEVKILNNTSDKIGPITVTVYSLETSPKSVATAGPNSFPLTTNVEVLQGCMANVFFVQDLNGQKLNISGRELEIEVTGANVLRRSVLIYSRTTNAEKNITANEFNSSGYIGM